MIKANELRLDNKIWYKSEFGNLINTVSVEDIAHCLSNNESFNEQHIPITLTEEILLKCGFVKINDSEYILGNYTFFNKMLFLNGYRVSELNFKYLHQLQNLYFALTNQELTINNLK